MGRWVEWAVEQQKIAKGVRLKLTYLVSKLGYFTYFGETESTQLEGLELTIDCETISSSRTSQWALLMQLESRKSIRGPCGWLLQDSARTGWSFWSCWTVALLKLYFPRALFFSQEGTPRVNLIQSSRHPKFQPWQGIPSTKRAVLNKKETGDKVGAV